MNMFNPRQLVVYYSIGTLVEKLGCLGFIVDWGFLGRQIEVLLTETALGQKMFNELIEYYKKKGFSFFESSPEFEYRISQIKFF